MSIVAYTGLPGHGKSYGIVDNVILPSLKNKRVIYTNIPMNDEKCLHDFGMCVVPFDIADIVKNPFWFKDVFAAGSILVIDELWRLWPSGLKATNVREGDKEFLAEHRHLVGANGFSTEIYFVTQDLSQIASFARALVENTFRMTKRSNIGLDKAFRVDVYSGPVTGPKPPVSQREREIHGGVFKKEIYAYYKSHTKSETGQAGDESRTDKRFNSLKRLSIKLGFVLAAACLVAVYFGLGKVKNMYTPAPASKDVKKSVSSSSPAQPLQPSRIPANAKVAVTEPPTQAKFLSTARRFTVSHILGLAPNKLFYYKVYFEHYEVLLSSLELKSLGYTLAPVNDCLVKVTGFDYNGFAMCAKAGGGRGNGLIANIASELTTTPVNDAK